MVPAVCSADLGGYDVGVGFEAVALAALTGFAFHPAAWGFEQLGHEVTVDPPTTKKRPTPKSGALDGA